jgi:hypothetical protein
MPRPPFGVTSLILPSCLTWALLAPLISRGTWRRAVLVGLVSPFLGSVFVVLLRIGPAGEIVYTSPGSFPELLSNSIRVFFHAVVFIGITAYVTFPVGALAGLVVYGIFRMWPAQPRSETMRRPLHATRFPDNVYLRLLLSGLPLLPLLGLLIPDTRQGPQHVISIWRVLAEMYFMPATMIQFYAARVGLSSPISLDVLLRVIYAAALAALVYRALSKRAPSQVLP